jgi:hypothetical protein
VVIHGLPWQHGGNGLMGWSGGTFTRTDGTRTGSNVWVDAAAANVKILAVDADTHDQDLADGINASLHKAGQNTPTANLPMGNFRHTGVGNAQARTDYLAAGQAQDQGVTFATSTGSANAYVVDLSPSLTAYATGTLVCMKANFSNTASATVNVDSVGAKTITDVYGNNLIGGEIQSGAVYQMVFDGTNFILLSSPAIQQAALIQLGGFTVSDSSETQITMATTADIIFDNSSMIDYANGRIYSPAWCTAMLVHASITCGTTDTDEINLNIRQDNGHGASSVTPTNWYGQSDISEGTGAANLFGVTISAVATPTTPGSTYYTAYITHNDAGATAADFQVNFGAQVLR